MQDLLLVWAFAAFGEEIGYRGYLLTRAADLGNRSRPAYIAAIIYVAVLFGFGHFYKGPTGVIDSTYSGLVLGAVYLLAGRNLWASILTPGIRLPYLWFSLVGQRKRRSYNSRSLGLLWSLRNCSAGECTRSRNHVLNER